MNKSKNIMEELELFITRGLREFPVCSIATETIENSAKYNKKKLSDEEVKQDCESKAFIRMASKLKKRFPRLPICIVADGLYVSEKVLKTCQNNRWD